MQVRIIRVRIIGLRTIHQYINHGQSVKIIKNKIFALEIDKAYGRYILWIDISHLAVDFSYKYAFVIPENPKFLVLALCSLA